MISVDEELEEEQDGREKCRKRGPFWFFQMHLKNEKPWEELPNEIGMEDLHKLLGYF